MDVCEDLSNLLRTVIEFRDGLQAWANHRVCPSGDSELIEICVEGVEHNVLKPLEEILVRAQRG